MIRSRLAFLKHISFALAALVFIPCVSEVGLRISDWHNSSRRDEDHGDSGKLVGLIAKCRLSHHRLLPSREIKLTHPDTGNPVLLRTNSFGTRGAEIDVPKPPGVYRILCLGDERTLAAGVREEETFCRRLEEFLQARTRFRIEVVNAGIPESCPLLSYLQLKHFLLSLQPDLTVVNFDMSDVSDDHRHRRHTKMQASGLPLTCVDPAWEAKSFRAGLRLEDQFLVVKWCRRQLGLIPADSNTVANRRDIDTPQGRFAWLRNNPPNWTVYIEQALSSLVQLNGLSKGSFSRLVVAVCPAPWQVDENATPGAGIRAELGIPENTRFESMLPFETILNYAREHGLAFCDTYTPFLQAVHPDQLFLRNSPEFSSAGHELYARRLAEFVISTVPGIWNSDTPNTRHLPLSESNRSIRR